MPTKIICQPSLRTPFRFTSLSVPFGHVKIHTYTCIYMQHHNNKLHYITFKHYIMQSLVVKNENISIPFILLFDILSHSVVFLFVRFLIQPLLPSIPTIPTWLTPPLLDLFQCATWSSRQILFCHFSIPFAFTCSIMLLPLVISFGELPIISCFLHSHDACPLSPNLIDMKESEEC